MMKKTGISIVLFFGIIVLINFISDFMYFRIDLTEDNQYTMSEATEDILSNLEEPVTIKAYFSENLPPDIAKTKKNFEEYLVEYARLSNDNIVYQFIDPTESPEKEKEAMDEGIGPVMINVRDKNEVKQQKAFLGVIIELGDEKEIIPVVQPGSALEYSLSSAIKKVSATSKPSIGYIQGHGEPAINEINQVVSELNVLYNVEPFNIDSEESVPGKYSTLILLRPTDTIQIPTLNKLDSFLQRGGNMFVALNSVNGDLSTSAGSSAKTGVEQWLQTKGILIDDSFLIDTNCGNVSVQQQQGFFTFNTPIEFPYLPIISNFSDHSITKGLEAILMQFASPMIFSPQDSLKTFRPLAFSSEKSSKLSVPLYFDVQKKWNAADFPLSRQVVAGLFEEKFTNGFSSKIVIIGDGDFPVAQQQGGRGGGRIAPDNLNLMVNSVDWISDNSGLSDLRTKGISYRPLDQIEDSTKSLLKYLNFLLPIILVIVYGFVRSQINRSKRVKRMEINYEK